MSRFYITTIVIQVILIIFLIHMYETKIYELELDNDSLKAKLDIALSPYHIQHSPYCSDSMLF